jgi:hypothetical protein
MVHLSGTRTRFGPGRKAALAVAAALAAVGAAPNAGASAPSGPRPCSNYSISGPAGVASTYIETPCPAADPVPGVFPQVQCTTAVGTSYDAHFATALQGYAPLHRDRFSLIRRDVRVAVLTASFKLSYYRAAVVKVTGRFEHGRFTGVASLSGAPCGHRQKWSAPYNGVSHFNPVP